MRPAGEVVGFEFVDGLFRFIEPRGREAAGVAFWAEGQGWTVAKRPGPVSKNMDQFERLWNDVQPSVALLHTRLSSHGSPRENRNNHPIMGKHSFVLHNGVVNMGGRYQARGDTDTEQLVLAIEALGMEQALRDCHGSYACFRVDLDMPHEVQVFRNHWSPLSYLDLSGDGTVLFASTPFRMRDGGVESREVKAGQLMTVGVKDVVFGEHRLDVEQPRARRGGKISKDWRDALLEDMGGMGVRRRVAKRSKWKLVE